MNRPVLVALLLVTSSIAVALAVPATGQRSNVAVTSVTTTPGQPNPGETFLVETTVSNGERAPGAFEITDIYVRRAGSARSLARVEDVGGVQPGSSLTVPLPMTIDAAGTHDLRVYVVGDLNGTRTRLKYPLLVPVRESGPQLLVETGNNVVGAETTATVAVVNGGQAPVSTLRLEVGGENVAVDAPTRAIATLAAGEQRTINVSVTPTAPNATLQTVLTYATEGGTARTVRETTPLDPAALERDVSLDARVLGDGADPPIGVTVGNFGNAPLEDLTVAVLVDGTVVARRPGPVVPPDAERDVRLNVSGLPNGPTDVRVTYQTAGTQEQTTTTLAYRSNPGTIAVTGVDYEVDGDDVMVSGSVSNLGLTDVNSVVVSVNSAPGVEPTRPYPDYFVGTVPASDFASFDLSATVDTDADTVPIEVRYLVQGEQRVVSANVSVADRPAPAADGGGPSALTVVIGAVVALLVVGTGAYLYRRR